MKYKRYLIDGSLTEKRALQIIKKRAYNENYRKKKKSANGICLTDCDIPPSSSNLLPNSDVNPNISYSASTLEEGNKRSDNLSFFKQGIETIDTMQTKDKNENCDSTEGKDMEYEHHSLLSTLKRNKRKRTFCIESEDSISSIASDSDDEYYKKVHQLKKKFSSLRKKCKLMETEKKKYENSLMEKNECINYLKMELRNSIANTNEKLEKLDLLIEKTEKIKNFLEEKSDEVINLLKQNNERRQDIISSESNTYERSTSKKDDSEMIQLGPVKVNKHTLARVESISKNSMFVKELSLLFWTEEELMDRSVSGRKASNCKTEREPKPPLTPEKLATIRDIFTKRIMTSQYPECLDLELKLLNKYLGEKINDLRKCKARKRLSFLERFVKSAQ